MRKLFIVLTLFGASILNAQQLNVASYNVRNSNPNDAKAGWMGATLPNTYTVNHFP